MNPKDESFTLREGPANRVTQWVVSVWGSPRSGLIASWAVLLAGLVLWITVQGTVVALPVWTRGSLPEPDDTYPYLARTRQMEECFTQDCPALDNLRKQVLIPSSDPLVARQRAIGASPFHIYHPLFSVLLVSVRMWGVDLETAYKVVWSLAPVFFGLAFAYFLVVLFGVPAAGIAISLLAFKVYPDSGLHFVVPSNLTMGVALIFWARIISQRGDAPWAMTLGSLVLCTLHPVGLVYSLMAGFIAFFVSGRHLTKRMWFGIAVLVCILTLGLIIPSVVRRPHFVLAPLFPSGGDALVRMIQGVIEAVGIEIFPQIFKGEDTLFGSIPWFCLALAFGLVTLPQERRRAVGSALVVICSFAVAMLFHVASHPADLFFRLWIPLLAVLFGAIGSGICYAFHLSGNLLIARLRGSPRGPLTFPAAWPVVVLALFAGYSFHMLLSGLEYCYGTALYMRDRFPAAFDTRQPKALLSAAQQRDRVLYTSPIIMSHYFAQGAMKLGAVYYHPHLRGTETGTEWLGQPDIRFAAAYNPTMYHPRYDLVLEKDWGISCPDFIFTTLSKPRPEMPIAVNGSIRSSSFRWIGVEPRSSEAPAPVRVLIKNPGKTSWIGLDLRTGDRDPVSQSVQRTTIPAGWSGWLDLGFPAGSPPGPFRIVLPDGEPPFLIDGISLGQDGYRWPWPQKAMLTFMPRDPSSGPIRRSFDPAALVPPPLNQRRVSVLDDKGSTVLLAIDR